MRSSTAAIASTVACGLKACGNRCGVHQLLGEGLNPDQGRLSIDREWVPDPGRLPPPVLQLPFPDVTPVTGEFSRIRETASRASVNFYMFT